MSYPYQIKSLEEYHQAYKESVENPDKLSESYGTIRVGMPKPFNYYGSLGIFPLD